MKTIPHLHVTQDILGSDEREKQKINLANDPVLVPLLLRGREILEKEI